jgi:NAD dependent epimerase/dehydratase
MKNCLITGADGFIGSHLTELLLSKGFKVRALAQYNSFNSWGWLENINQDQNLEIVTGDIRDLSCCKRITKNIDKVFHLAALIGIPYSYTAPDSYIETNIKGTYNMCQSSLENGVSHFIQTSTSEVYGTARLIPINEAHPKQPQSPYAASKIGADAMAMSFYYSFNLPLTIARPFNVYGPRQSARAILPSVILQILGGSRKIMVGDITPTRDMNFVKDTCKGFLAISECDKSLGKEINISSNSEISIYDLLRKLIAILGSEAEIEIDPQRIRPSKSEVLRLIGDNSLISELTEFKPEYDIDKGLEETCAWFLSVNNRSKYKDKLYNV